MLSRVTMARKGLVDYLITGKVKGSDLTRQDKDNVVSLYGDISKIKEAEIYTNNYKNWNYNYEHLTVSFSADDEKILNDLTEDERLKALKEISQIYIKHRTSGYDIDSEVVAYAEYHNPKIKTNDKGKARLPHIHIGISYLNPLSDTKLQTTFYNNSFISDVLDKFVSKRYGLTYAEKKENREKNFTSKNGILRSEWIYKLLEINDEKELLQYFKKESFIENVDYCLVETKKNRYYKLIGKGIKYKLEKEVVIDINITGKGFERFNTKNYTKAFEDLKEKDLKELQVILDDYYQDRVEQIGRRRSKETNYKLKSIYEIESNTNNKKNEKSIENININNKIYLKHFDYIHKDKYKNYTIENQNEKIVIKDEKKDIKIIDDNFKISSESKSTNLKEEVELMIDICLDKGWKLEELKVNYENEEFKNIAIEIIAKKIKEKEEKYLPLKEERKNKIKEVNELNHSEIASLKKELEERKYEKTIDNELTPEIIKKDLKAEIVLNYCVERFLLKKDNYELAVDNKINNKTNRQKPVNVIEFLKREINLTSGESIETCKTLLKNHNCSLEMKKVLQNDEKKSEIEDEKNIKKAVMLGNELINISNEENSLYFVDKKSIARNKAEELIKKYEIVEKEENNINGKIIKTKENKYLIIKDSIIYDYKNKTILNNLTFLEKKIRSKNLYKIANEASKVYEKNYIKLNHKLLKEELLSAISTSKNIFEVEKMICKNLKTNIKLDSEKIIIDGDIILLKDLNISKIEFKKENKNTKELQI